MTATATSNTTTTLGVRNNHLALVAGDGKLPAILAQSAKERGWKVFCLALSESAKERVEGLVEKVWHVPAGQMGRNIKILRDHGCDQGVFVGKVPKLDLLKNIVKLDWLAVKELSKLPNFNDDTIQVGVGDVCERHGIHILTQSEFLRHLFPDVGVLTKRQPTITEYADIDYGFTMAKELARMDIGQTIIVKDRSIIAIEAIEGTDRAIQRGVQLMKGPVVVVKVSKPNQDQRFDIPTVGMTTMNSMTHADKLGGVLAIEANETMMVEQEEMIKYADAHDMSIVAVTASKK